MATPTIDFILKGNFVMHDHSESDLGAVLDSRYLKLNQTSPQVTVGNFTFPSVIATNYLQTPKIYPLADSTTAIQFNKADGTTNVLNIDTTNARVGIGTTSPGYKLETAAAGSTAYAHNAISLYNAGSVNYYPYYLLRKSKSNTLGTITQTVDTDILGVMLFQGVTSGSAFSNGARIYAVQNGTSGASYIPTNLVFATSDGTASYADRVIITSGGNIGIGTTSPGGRLHIVGNVDDEQLIVTGNSSQTASLAEFRNSVGTVLSKINGDGSIYSNLNLATALKIEQSGVRNNVVVVDTRSGGGIGGGDAGLGIGTTPSYLLHVYYAGANVAAWNPVVFDASASSVTTQAIFGVRTSATTPTAGHHKAFMCWYGTDSIAFASFEFNVGGASKPGFALGPGGVTSRDIGLVRETTNVARVCDGSTGYGSLLVSGLTIGSTTTVTANALTLNNANVILGTTTGTKIGTATSQKLGLWNTTPIIQPTTAVASATFVQSSGNTVNDASTFDGYTLLQVVKALRNMGALA